MTASRNLLVGSWNVLSFWIEFEDSDDRDEPYGANPNGCVACRDTPIAGLAHPEPHMGTILR